MATLSSGLIQFLGQGTRILNRVWILFWQIYLLKNILHLIYPLQMKLWQHKP